MEKSIVIEAGKSARLYWEDVWRFRELLLALTWRDVVSRYKQTVLGVSWAVVKPLATMLVLTIVFSRVAHLPSEGAVAYPLMVFTALLPWALFSTCFSAVAGSMVGNANLVTKVYCPRILVPIATLGRPLVDFAISAVLLCGMMCFYRYIPPLHIMAVVPLILLTLLLAFGPGLILGALSVVYRDFISLGSFILQLGLYVSPVGFSSSVVSERWRPLYDCNPLVGIIDGFRWAVLDSVPFPGRALCVSVGFAVLFAVLGISVFRRIEHIFADII